MQEARHVIEETAPNQKRYQALLIDYNNDPSTTFANIQNLFRLVEQQLTKQLEQETPRNK
jgi:Zn-dependent M32 family carboxypeptidase